MVSISDLEVVKPQEEIVKTIKKRRKSGHIDLPEGLTREALEAMTRQLKTPADVHTLLLRP